MSPPTNNAKGKHHTARPNDTYPQYASQLPIDPIRFVCGFTFSVSDETHSQSKVAKANAEKTEKAGGLFSLRGNKQTSVDSGSVAVVLLDGDEGLVKKVFYGADWIELHSINPMYPPVRFDGPDVMRIQVVGLVKKVIKEI